MVATNGITSDRTPSGQPLTILIVGAGIGGLTAAISLRRQGHKTILFEQSRLANEIGAAINVAPNCNGILRRLGLYLEKHGGVECTAFMFGDGEETSRQTKQWEGIEERFGYPYHLMHRAHLHTALKNMALSEEGEGTPSVLHTASRIVDVDPETATVTMQSGEEVRGDVIIGADGIHSRTRTYLPSASDIQPFSSGVAGFRFLIDVKRLRDNPHTAEYVKQPGLLARFVTRTDKQVLVMYPCQNNEVMNCMLALPTENTTTPGDSTWSNEASKEHMLSVASSQFGPGTRAVLEMADDDGLRLWDLMDMDTLPTWVVGKMALVGDAAHPFTPWRGQGGAMAIEDAASLGVMLPLGTQPEQIHERLELYQQCRRDRAHQIQDMSRKNSPIGSLTVENEAKGDAMKDYEVWLFGYDEVRNSREAFDRLTGANGHGANGNGPSL